MATTKGLWRSTPRRAEEEERGALAVVGREFIIDQPEKEAGARQEIAKRHGYFGSRKGNKADTITGPPRGN
jgi:hypothetical protein